MTSRPSPRSGVPAIVAPVSRHLLVTDLARSIAFYRDTLNFAVEPGNPASHHRSGVAAVVSGPARVQLETAHAGLDSSGQPRPPRPVILFFEVDDVTVMQDTVLARGGTPSELERANGIKMQMFELRDPDGHVLWFGQSFDQSDQTTPASQAMMQTIMPELPLNDVAAGIRHYRDVLGFHVNYAQHDLGVMDRDAVRVLLIARTDQRTGIVSCYLYVRDADALHAELQASGANVLSAPVSQPWGLREFRVLDCEGNRLTFGQPFE
jgi:predicted enzyme related to lactoylglutathione lyase